MDDRIYSFLDFIALEKSLSPRTVEAYARDLGQAEAALASRGVDLADATREDLTEYERHLAGLGLAVRSSRRKLSAVRSFFRFLAREGMRKDDPASLLRPPKGRMSLPSAVSVEAVTAMIEVWKDADPLSLRNRAILELAYGCGLRESELIDLTPDRVFLGDSYVRPCGKGGRERIVPLGGPARRALARYLDEARPALARRRTFPNLFLSFRGRPLSRMSIWEIVERSAVLAGLPEKVHPHLLRHSFATHLLEGGADLRVVQELLGHADIRTTEIYTNIDRTHLSEVMDDCHPRSERRR